MVDKIKRDIVEDSAVTESKLATGAVDQTALNKTAITGMGELTTIADDDKILILDTSADVLKKVNKSRMTGLDFPTYTSVSPTSSQTVDGGNITFTITGSGFTTGTNARLFSNTGVKLDFDSVTRVSTTSITATIARSSLLVAQSPYDIQVINGEGLSVVGQNQISVDTTPIFVTSAGSLGTFTEGDSVDITVEARDPDSSSAVTFEIQSGSLPAGLSLVNQSGDSCRITGTASAVSADTTSNFTLRAFDSSSNTVSRAFSITINDFTMSSARFDDDQTDYLSQTQGSGNRRTFTISAWVKRSNGFGNMDLIMSNVYPGIIVRFVSADESFQIYDGGGSSFQLRTNRVFRDPSAWYHLVIAVDTTDATSGDRIKMYINGTRETSFQTANYPSQNYDTGFNNGLELNIAREAGQSNYFDGYMSDVVVVDGTALTPTSFGETDSNGVWIPKNISGITFGTCGFHLDFSDGADLGNDISGNNNDFTENNITSVSKSLDIPQNNYATFNPLAPMVHKLEDGNLKIDGQDQNWDSSFSTIGASSGKWYMEMKFISLHGGLVRAAMGLVDARDQTLMATNEVGYNITGTVGDSVGYNGNGTSNNVKKNDANQYSAGVAWVANDIIAMAVDLDNGAVYFRINDNSWLNSGNPESGASRTGAVTITTGETYVFGATAYGTSTDFEFNWGAPSFAITSSNSDANGHGSFEYAVPSGYFALNTKNLAEHG